MEERKIKEINHYNSNIGEYSNEKDFEGFNPFLLSSLNFLRNYFIKNLKNKKVLDFGCGNGIHSRWLENYSEKVIGIDLSEKSLDIAKKRTIKSEFLEMDCENLSFKDESFDVVFDGGTFSSLDINKSIEEIIRVLKKEVFL